MKPSVSATSKGEWLRESGNKTSTLAARDWEREEKASWESSQALQQEHSIRSRGVNGGQGQSSKDCLHWGSWEVILWVWWRQTFFWPFPGIAVVGRWAEVSHQSSLCPCHHRSWAESTSNPLRCLPWHQGTAINVQEVHLAVRYHDLHQGLVLCSSSLHGPKKAGVSWDISPQPA